MLKSGNCDLPMAGELAVDARPPVIPFGEKRPVVDVPSYVEGAIIALNARGEVTFLNQAAQALIGVSLEDETAGQIDALVQLICLERGERVSIEAEGGVATFDDRILILRRHDGVERLIKVAVAAILAKEMNRYQGI